MNTKIVPAMAGVLLAVSCSFSQRRQATVPETPALMKGKCVVELFTSEGCSSCPSADALMPKLREQYGDALLVLSFHVDYWDRLGWKDAFSQPAWTQRQQQYAAALNTDNIYTPQAVVNGKSHITGSNRSVLERLIAVELAETRPASISLSARKEGDSIAVAYDVPLKAGEAINIALVRHHAVTSVGRGENGGRRLQHYNVVLSFRSADAGKGALSFAFPPGLAKADVGVIAFVQQSGDMHITAGGEAGVE